MKVDVIHKLKRDTGRAGVRRNKIYTVRRDKIYAVRLGKKMWTRDNCIELYRGGNLNLQAAVC